MVEQEEGGGSEAHPHPHILVPHHLVDLVQPIRHHQRLHWFQIPVHTERHRERERNTQHHGNQLTVITTYSLLIGRKKNTNSAKKNKYTFVYQLADQFRKKKGKIKNKWGGGGGLIKICPKIFLICAPA